MVIVKTELGVVAESVGVLDTCRQHVIAAVAVGAARLILGVEVRLESVCLILRCVDDILMIPNRVAIVRINMCTAVAVEADRYVALRLVAERLRHDVHDACH